MTLKNRKRNPRNRNIHQLFPAKKQTKLDTISVPR